MTTRMPAIFFGHGNPMNALQQNKWTESWSTIGRTLPRPRAILCISAHWYLPATLMTAMNTPRTIHDFGGFPREPEPYAWAVRFETLARQLMVNSEFDPLIKYGTVGLDALLAIPTPDHYLPLLYVLGTKQPDDEVSFPVEGVDGGSISMLAVHVGWKGALQ